MSDSTNTNSNNENSWLNGLKDGFENYIGEVLLLTFLHKSDEKRPELEPNKGNLSSLILRISRHISDVAKREQFKDDFDEMFNELTGKTTTNSLPQEVATYFHAKALIRHWLLQFASDEKTDESKNICTVEILRLVEIYKQPNGLEKVKRELGRSGVKSLFSSTDPTEMEEYENYVESIFDGALPRILKIFLTCFYLLTLLGFLLICLNEMSLLNFADKNANVSFMEVIRGKWFVLVCVLLWPLAIILPLKISSSLRALRRIKIIPALVIIAIVVTLVFSYKFLMN